MILPQLYEKTLGAGVLTLQELKTIKTGVPAAKLSNHIKLLLRRGYWGLVRKGLYYVIPIGRTAQETRVDPLLVGSKAAEDATLAYGSALDFYGFQKAPSKRVLFFSRKSVLTFRFNEFTFRRVSFSARLERNKQAGRWIKAESFKKGYVSNRVRVTSLERTIVDAIHRMDLSGGLDRVRRAIQKAPPIDARLLVQYALALGVSSIYGKIGFLLERYGRRALRNPRALNTLKAKLPQFIPYLEKRAGSQTYDPQWRVIVPDRLAVKRRSPPSGDSR